jgi:hypothetical protein
MTNIDSAIVLTAMHVNENMQFLLMPMRPDMLVVDPHKNAPRPPLAPPFIIYSPIFSSAVMPDPPRPSHYFHSPNGDFLSDDDTKLSIDTWVGIIIRYLLHLSSVGTRISGSIVDRPDQPKCLAKYLYKT